MPTDNRFLIIRTSSIGDVLHCTPVARALKRAMPEAHIAWLVGESPADLLYANPYIDEVLVWPREKFDKAIQSRNFYRAWQLWNDLRKELRARTFDVVLDVHGLLLSGMMAIATDAPKRIGLNETKELNWLFMNQMAPKLASGTHVIQRYLSVLSPLGIDTDDYRMTLALTPADMDFADAFLQHQGIGQRKPLVALSPRTTWQSKNWPLEYYAALAKQLVGDANILLCGSPSDQDAAAEFIRQAQVPLINAVGKTTLRQLATLLVRSKVLVAGDTGPLHMAIALGVPTVSIFGPSDPLKVGPLDTGHIVLTSNIPCSFCYKQNCPDKNSNQCLYAITPEKVFTAVKSLME